MRKDQRWVACMVSGRRLVGDRAVTHEVEVDVHEPEAHAGFQDAAHGKACLLSGAAHPGPANHGRLGP